MSAFRLRAPVALERDEQAALMQHAAIRARTDARWGLLFAIPNGKAASSIREAVIAKRTGLKRGVPDLFLPVPMTGLHGLFVELKRTNGTDSDLSAEQRDWLTRLHQQGYRAIVAYGWVRAAEEIEWYLAGNPA